MSGLIALAALFVQPEPMLERLPPVEQCAGEAGLDEFRERLKDVVSRRDEQALLAMLSDDVEVNFGGDRGPELFAANWKFEESGESHVWDELLEAIGQGCAPSGDAFVAPSFVTQFPHQLDAFETLILRPGAQLHSAKTGGPVEKGDLDWHLASIVDNTDETWVRVRLVRGRDGFVRRDETINPLGYRLVFEKVGGEWRIVAFLAGD
jgi:hypothetical protein